MADLKSPKWMHAKAVIFLVPWPRNGGFRRGSQNGLLKGVFPEQAVCSCGCRAVGVIGQGMAVH